MTPVPPLRVLPVDQPIIGPLGRAEPISLDPKYHRVAEHAATLGQWLVSIPSAHPIWPVYLFAVIHLRDVPGQSRAPIRRVPGASHELLLGALDPRRGPFNAATLPDTAAAAEAAGRGMVLHPLNLVEQISGVTDDQARELAFLLAWSLVNGILPAEPSDYLDGRDMWRATIAKTLEHILLGTHPEHN